MTQSFNLIDQKWIPCETPEGGFTELGLRDTLARAHELRGITADSPLETAALYRLLLTVLHRVFGPSSTEAWFALWQSRQWDGARLSAYWEVWYDRFDLLHPDENRRFFQRKPLTGEPRPIIHMVHSRGNKPALFSHVTDANQSGMTLSEAARALLTTQAFRLGGQMSGQSDKDEKSGVDGPAARGISFLFEGESLFETTIFNLWCYVDQNFMQITGIPQTRDDVPAWEQEDVFNPSRDLPLGYLDYLNWQNYRVWLEAPKQDNRIYEVRIGKGLPKLANSVFDPFKHHHAIKKGSQNPSGYTPLHFDEDRALWRDSATILEQAQTQEGRADKQPHCVMWFDTLFNAEDSEGALHGYERLPLIALGMASKPGQHEVFFYRQERIPLPADYLQNRQLVTLLRGALIAADVTRDGLYGALYGFAAGLVVRDQINQLVKHWNVEQQYWGALEPAFWQLVTDLPHDDTEPMVTWVEIVIQTAHKAYVSAEELAGSDTRALKAAVAGRRILGKHVRKMRKDMGL